MEIVEDDVSGWLVPPGDIEALSRVMTYGLTDPDRLSRLGTSARIEALKRFDAGVLRMRFLRILESVVVG